MASQGLSLSLLKPWAVPLVGCLVLAGSTFALGYHAGSARYVQLLAEDTQAAALAKASAKAVHATDIATGAIIQAVTDKALSGLPDQAAIKEKAHAYITPVADSHCTVSHGAVQLFNDTASGSSVSTPAEAPSGADASVAPGEDTPSGVPLSLYAEVAADNNTELGRCLVLYKGWQDWYTSVEANHGTVP